MNFCSSLQPPASSQRVARIADAVAEDEVEPEAGLVDEVVHVALEASVVVAHEGEPLFLVDPDPAREVNRSYARQPPARVDVLRGVVEDPQAKEPDCAADESGLERPNGAEDDCVTSRSSVAAIVGAMTRIDARTDLGIGCFREAVRARAKSPRRARASAKERSQSATGATAPRRWRATTRIASARSGVIVKRAAAISPLR